jgi:branched-subunit amino acid ABC-type transport system permease component
MIVQIIWTSIATSSYYILFAVAFALVLKVTKIWNFAQSGFMTIAFYIMYWAINKLALPIPLALSIALFITILASWAVDKYAFGALRRMKSGGFTYFIFTLIFSEFIAYLLTLLFGTEPFTVFPNIFSPAIPVGGIVVSYWDLRSIIITGILLAGLYALLRWSKPGKFLIAVSNNDRLAELYGISSRQAYTLSMILAAILCTFGMYVLGTKIAVHPHLGLSLILFAVAATVMGGIGNVFSAAMAAVFLCFLQGFSILIIPSRWQNLLLFFFFFMIIIFMPSGFLSFIRAMKGRRE